MSDTMDDPALLERQSAYLSTLHSLGRAQRTAGFVFSLVGIMMVVVARFRLGGAPWLLWGGAAVVAIGWGFFVYAVARRVLWVRAHPFDPKA